MPNHTSNHTKKQHNIRSKNKGKTKLMTWLIKTQHTHTQPSCQHRNKTDWIFPPSNDDLKGGDLSENNFLPTPEIINSEN